MNQTISKVFAEIPFGHRQATHKGHCRHVHGHGWTVKVTFGCTSHDENGFIIDFGKLGFLKDWITQYLDHALVLAASDPALDSHFRPLEKADLCKLLIVPDCSAEGLSRYIHDEFSVLVGDATNDRVWVTAVEVFEDSKNSARYED